jgi:SAM-dependent methyltransferase
MWARGSQNPVVVTARGWMDEFNARHPWSHNDHFHHWILRNLPANRRLAVDVGCGPGVLAGKLAGQFTRVTGIDPDEDMAAAASARLAGNPQVSIVRCGFAELAAAASQGEADLVTMVASLHHIDLADTLARIPGLLAPGGRFLVVGLARVDSLADEVVDLVSLAANPLMGVIKHPRPARRPGASATYHPAMPEKDPATSLAEIAAAAGTRLPGAAIRRRLFFRYTLRWEKLPE